MLLAFAGFLPITRHFGQILNRWLGAAVTLLFYDELGFSDQPLGHE
jgi:hypothetical protein